MPSFIRLLNPITFFLFIPLSLLLFMLQHALQRLGLDAGVLFTGNLLLYLITTAALYFHYKGIIFTLTKKKVEIFRLVS
jgi:hypothetical protein